jgi:hypothetical protein
MLDTCAHTMQALSGKGDGDGSHDEDASRDCESGQAGTLPPKTSGGSSYSGSGKGLVSIEELQGPLVPEEGPVVPRSPFEDMTRSQSRYLQLEIFRTLSCIHSCGPLTSSCSRMPISLQSRALRPGVPGSARALVFSWSLCTCRAPGDSIDCCFTAYCQRSRRRLGTRQAS